MQSEIEGEFLKAKKEARDVRRRKGTYIIIICLLIVLFFIIPYSWGPSLTGLYAIEVIIVFVGGMYIFFSAAPSVFQPLPVEKQAFIQVYNAIEVLRKSKEPIAFQESLKYLEKADRILDAQFLYEKKWYERTNQSLLEFRGNLTYLIIPSTEKFKIKVEHLEEIALALSKMDPERIKEINQKLESEPTYVKIQPQLQKPLMTILRESKIAKIGYSLSLGYVLIVVICVIYVTVTGQDFSTFVKNNPTIVILGGLGLSGLTFWKT